MHASIVIRAPPKRLPRDRGACATKKKEREKSRCNVSSLSGENRPTVTCALQRKAVLRNDVFLRKVLHVRVSRALSSFTEKAFRTIE